MRKTTLNNRTYLVLLADRKYLKLFTLFKGSVSSFLEFSRNDVPQKVKHGSNTWDAPDKINRHIQFHLNEHLKSISRIVENYVKEYPVDKIIVGGHKEFFHQIKKMLPYPLSERVIGDIIIGLKNPINNITKKALLEIEKIEARG